MFFSDIHFHALAGVDDGPRQEAAMFSLVETAYREGSRLLFLTPHFHPGYYGDNTSRTTEMFLLLSDRVRKTCPDLTLLPGNELHYSPGCLTWLTSGACRTMNGTRYVLVDFATDSTAVEIQNGLEHLLRGGYLPILAHAERYPALPLRFLRAWKQDGILIQLNAASVLYWQNPGQYRRCHAILSADLADFVASDAHNLTSRPPHMLQAYQKVAAKYGTGLADHLFCQHAVARFQQSITGRN